ncbi:hypothetical protein LZ30DRAFT_738865 [Colletotrichum cereale]|nr:hypothetical protein LZ30DRAFT_738865 [Colletotrichum cereale]
MGRLSIGPIRPAAFKPQIGNPIKRAHKESRKLAQILSPPGLEATLHPYVSQHRLFGTPILCTSHTGIDPSRCEDNGA